MVVGKDCTSSSSLVNADGEELGGPGRARRAETCCVLGRGREVWGIEGRGWGSVGDGGKGMGCVWGMEGKEGGVWGDGRGRGWVGGRKEKEREGEV